MSFNREIGIVVEVHLRVLRVLRVLRGVFLPISAAEHSFCALPLFDEDRQTAAKVFRWNPSGTELNSFSTSGSSNGKASGY